MSEQKQKGKGSENRRFSDRECHSYSKDKNRFTRAELSTLAIKLNIGNYKRMTITDLCKAIKSATENKPDEDPSKAYPKLKKLTTKISTLMPQSWKEYIETPFSANENPPEPIQLTALVLKSGIQQEYIRDRIERFAKGKLTKMLLAFVLCNRFGKPPSLHIPYINEKTGKLSRKKRAFADFTVYDICCWMCPWSNDTGNVDEDAKRDKKRLGWLAEVKKEISSGSMTLVDLMMSSNLDNIEIANFFVLHCGRPLRGRKGDWYRDDQKLVRFGIKELF
jgi:stalled ribosome alternative rescue factor ArfA